MNRAILCGHLGRDPESRDTRGGQVVRLSVATSERRKDRDGNWTDHTEWHRVVCFGRTAENCARFLSKGRQVLVEGRIQTSTYEKDGETRYSTEIVAERVEFVGGRGDAAPSRSTASRGYSSTADDDVPF
jgi:single-strand DNA-binding protein